MTRFLAAGFFLVLTASEALAQSQGLDELLKTGLSGTSAEIIRVAALVTALSLGPMLVIMLTSFTRLIIAFSFLRSSIGLTSTPANLVLVTLALFLTGFIMSPVFNKAYEEGVRPLQARSISEAVAFERSIAPFKKFMLAQVREKDLALFQELAGKQPIAPKRPEEVELRILVPAFMTSELRRGFEIGFLIALPFLVIDLVVATLAMSMGMMMLPPTAISLPFKVLFFVLIDGWSLLAESLVKSFGQY